MAPRTLTTRRPGSPALKREAADLELGLARKYLMLAAAKLDALGLTEPHRDTLALVSNVDDLRESVGVEPAGPPPTPMSEDRRLQLLADGEGEPV